MRSALVRVWLGLVVLGITVAASAQSLRPASPDSVGLSAERLERLSDVDDQAKVRALVYQAIVD